MIRCGPAQVVGGCWPQSGQPGRRRSNRNTPKLGVIYDLCKEHGWENVLRLVEHHPQAFRLVSMHNDTVGEWMGRMLEG